MSATSLLRADVSCAQLHLSGLAQFASCLVQHCLKPSSQAWALIFWSLSNLLLWLLTLSLGAAHLFQLIVLFSEDMIPAFNM